MLAVIMGCIIGLLLESEHALGEDDTINRNER
jgi:hypothetical protein